MTRTKKHKPRKETRKLMQPITRDDFHALLKRAVTTLVPRRAAK